MVVHWGPGPIRRLFLDHGILVSLSGSGFDSTQMEELRKMKIVHVVAGLWRNTGGPAEVIPNLCRAQAEAGANVTLCSIDGENAPQVEELRETIVDLQLFPATDMVVRYSASLGAYLRRRTDADVIHNHGHWLWPNWCAAAVARGSATGLVTTPHGTLVPGMLKRARAKKAVAWFFFDRRLIEGADVIHALSAAERTGMAPKLGRAARKTVVIPNGVNIPVCARRDIRERRFTLLFLSRVTQIKGVVQLLAAWRLLARDHPDWRLKIVGPIDDDLRVDFERLCMGAERVELVGPVYHQDRWQHYKEASAFVLPTLAEGLPTALLEAAAYRLPIVTTPEANFDELNRAGGCLLCESDPVQLEAALRRLFAMTPGDRQRIGERGWRLVSEHYNWQRIAARWLSVYGDIGKGADLQHDQFFLA